MVQQDDTRSTEVGETEQSMLQKRTNRRVNTEGSQMIQKKERKGGRKGRRRGRRGGREGGREEGRKGGRSGKLTKT